MKNLKPIVVILGQTASGKSSLSIKLAQEFNGEIISADSRNIYKNMDIGTAKPTEQDIKLVPHHGINLITPNQTYSAAEFKDYAKNVVTKTHQKAKLPIIVGGTGLYIDGYVYDFKFGGDANPKQRKYLELLNLNELQELAQQVGIAEQNSAWQNPRHLTRLVERGGVNTNRKLKPQNVLLIGLKIDNEELDKRIKERVDTMFSEGLIKEVQDLVTTYGSHAPGLNSPGYKEVIEYINNRTSLEETKEKIFRAHRQLAKRQNTWFKRNPDIVWCQNEHQAQQEIRAFLAKFATIDS